MIQPHPTEILTDALVLRLGEGTRVGEIHQMMYYVHAWGLLFCPSASLEEPFEAGVFGVFHERVHRRFFGRMMKDLVLPRDVLFPGHTLSQRIRSHVDEVLEAYRDFSPCELENMMKHDPVYRAARHGKKASERGGCMDNERIKRHFQTLWNSVEFLERPDGKRPKT